MVLLNFTRVLKANYYAKKTIDASILEISKLINPSRFKKFIIFLKEFTSVLLIQTIY